MQFGFQRGLGYSKALQLALFTVLETINDMLERGGNVSSRFLDVWKVFNTVWIDEILYKLFFELGIGGRIWKVIKGLYCEIGPAE